MKQRRVTTPADKIKRKEKTDLSNLAAKATDRTYIWRLTDEALKSMTRADLYIILEDVYYTSPVTTEFGMMRKYQSLPRVELEAIIMKHLNKLRIGR